VMCFVSLAAAVGATDPYGEIFQKLDQIIGELSAAEHRAASRTVRLDDIAARLDNLTLALDALQQQVDRASTLLPCPVGWRRIGTSCYIISSEDAWVSDAERACDRLAPGAHLASVHAETQQGINDMIASSGRPGVWIGLQRAGDTWAWSDGSVLDVTNWSRVNRATQAAMRTAATGGLTLSSLRKRSGMITAAIQMASTCASWTYLSEWHWFHRAKV